jgi:hypothetical protein
MARVFSIHIASRPPCTSARGRDVRLGRAGQRATGPGGAYACFVEVAQERKLDDDQAEHERTHAKLLALGARLRPTGCRLCPRLQAWLDARLHAQLSTSCWAGRGSPPASSCGRAGVGSQRRRPALPQMKFE